MKVKTSFNIFSEVHSGNYEDKKWFPVDELNEILNDKVMMAEHKINLIKKALSDKQDKVTLWCSEHGEQEGNVCKKCLSTKNLPNTTKLVGLSEKQDKVKDEKRKEV